MSVFGGNPYDQQKKIDGIKKIIAVGAGKGGVGKSTVATNLALALSKAQKKVGLLDADIYGPSVPRMLGVSEAKPNLTANNKIEPVYQYGIKAMSLGFLVEEGAAIIWRGPMLFKAIQQFLNDVNWGELDFLIVDLPPGTGDVQLTLTQKVPLDGAVIVSTPEDISLIDVTRCVDMFKRVKVPILGLIENMSELICEKCGHHNKLFTPGRLRKYCEEQSIQILGSIPFSPQIGSLSESGTPLMASSDNKNSTKPEYDLFQSISMSVCNHFKDESMNVT